jgi:hypothetical protein
MIDTGPADEEESRLCGLKGDDTTTEDVVDRNTTTGRLVICDDGSRTDAI